MAAAITASLANKCRLCRAALDPSKVRRAACGDALVLTPQSCSITSYVAQRHAPVVCACCGLAQSPFAVDQSLLASLYEDVEDPDFDKDYVGRKHAYARDLRRTLAKIDKPIARILEVGSFTGIAADAIREALPDVDYLGIEPSTWACEVARNRGHRTINGTIGADAPGACDLIMSWDVIEHLEDPHTLFDWCADLTRPGSYMFVNTPDWDSPWRKLMARRWWFIEPMHRVYFSQRSMKRLAADHDWRVLLHWSHRKTLSAPYFLQRIFTHLGITGRRSQELLKHVPPSWQVGFHFGQRSYLLVRGPT